ncbi:class I SAM-dependent methyltransferase [Chitinophaga nivalis]|uniref:Class I SAM-dependent methyltransferase n=1 Tax=Chitinophaga nivalis TaxID=2991709 RepID=A0ABT3IGZ7_9BACT|nr:class I SAM-dependent methyltransferase [Chitinophaga nivalis]MCW3467067.1 class I SAM-dependent methyltransferase [Chitinophaga nivalis]MCW3483242.1 class I SAM-dependent methyltransferase [Chitinophaga nivalis]
MAQYDPLAYGYRAVAEAIPYRGPEWYSLHVRLGDLTGCSVLDLGCGDGMSSRRLKSWGAAQVTGVDVSEEMIKLAQLTESHNPMGIEYNHADVTTMQPIGTFDVVTASYLLHYASSLTELQQMAQSAYDNLKPGKQFITSNLNPLAPPLPELDLPEHKLHYRLTSNLLADGLPMDGTLLHDGQQITFKAWWYSWQTYQTVFRDAGFTNCAIVPYLIPEEEINKYPPGFWAPYYAAPWVIQFICHKPLV